MIEKFVVGRRVFAFGQVWIVSDVDNHGCLALCFNQDGAERSISIDHVEHFYNS